MSASEEVEREWIDRKTGIAFVRIPAGSFEMGDPDEGYTWCQPVHRVTIGRDFWLKKFPVTNEEYGKFLAATGHREPKEWNNRRFNQPRQPVVGVSWDDAQVFCQWASFRLPTEAEWEFACRAGTTSAYSFDGGEEKLETYAWYAENSEQTQVVGGKLPNPWGLYDMHGNVWEWCADWYGGYTTEAVTDPPGSEQASLRVFRGGSWLSSARVCRSALRFGDLPSLTSLILGFRVAAVPPGGPSQEPGNKHTQPGA